MRIPRIEVPTLLDEELLANEQQDNDIQWTRIVELHFVPLLSVKGLLLSRWSTG